MAARELARRPRAFLVPMAILALLALLLLYPSSILDGLTQESTAAVRNAPADLVVYSHVANGVIVRSQVDASARQKADAVPGTASVATFDVYPFAGTIEGKPDPVGFALTASDQALGSRAPAPGEAIADVNLRNRFGVAVGSKILIGPSRTPVTVVDFGEGSNLFFFNGLVVHKATWLRALSSTEATAAGPSDTDPALATAALTLPSQVLLVTLEDGAAPTEVAAAIDEATAGATQTLTRDMAVQSMPGIAEQEATFGYMRGITLTVALVVVALFLSFMTLERAPLYAALKAIGAASRQLFFALVFQVLLITGLAVTIAATITWSLTRLPTELPTIMQPNRVIETTVALAITAVLGSGISLRRVINVDPADAIG